MAKKSKSKDLQVFSFNKHVDNLIARSDWHIEESWGRTQLAEYVNQVEMSSSGMRAEVMEQLKAQKLSQRPSFVDVEMGSFESTLDTENITKNSVAVLKLSGVMQMNDSLSHNGINTLNQQIELCNQNPNICAIVIEANSGGGESIAGQSLMNTVKDRRKVIVTYAHLMASACSRGLSPSDHIMLAGGSTETGSLGSAIIIDKVLAAFHKATKDEIYSGLSPNKNREWREYLKGNKGPMIESVAKNALALHNDMKDNRNLNPALIDDTLKGGMFQCDDAINRGLADSKGTLNDAIKLAYELGTKNKNSINSKSNNMFNFQKGWKDLVTTLNEVFSMKSDVEADPEKVNESMDLKAKMESFKNSVVAAATSNMNDVLTDLKKSNEVLTAKVEELSKNQGNSDTSITEVTNELNEVKVTMNALKAQNVTLTKEKKDMEVQIATLTGNTNPGTGGEGGQDTGNPASIVKVDDATAKFDTMVNALVELKGEAEYG